MTQFQMGVGRPIYSVQEFLRVIAQSNGNISPIVPDGIFGPETQTSVRTFQIEYGLENTGEINEATWNKIVEVYEEVIIYSTPVSTTLFPSPGHVIREGDKADFHYPIHAVIYALSKRFDNIDEFDEISDVHEGGVVDATKQLQILMGVDCGGELDIKCWNMLSRLYENVVAKETFDIGLGATQPPIILPAPTKDNEDSALRERFVDREELNEDMRREAIEKDRNNNMFREGVITPRLEPMGIDVQMDEEDVSDNIRLPQPQMQNKMQEIDENMQDINRGLQIQTTQPQMQDMPMPPEQNREMKNTKPKIPPLKWNFK